MNRRDLPSWHPAFRSVPDPSVTSATQVPVAPELHEIDRRIGGFSIGRWTLWLHRIASRLFRRQVDLSGVRVDRVPSLGRGALMVTPTPVEGPAGAGPVPEAGVVFLIHGGGYVIGTNREALGYAATFARQLGVRVVCPAYSLAPEQQFPAGLDDLHAAWHRLLEAAADLRIDSARMAIGGISAGGGLAAALVQRLYDEGGAQPAAQLLVYPMLDDRVAHRRELDDVKHRCWDNKCNSFAWRCYLGGKGGGEALAYAVPARRGDLAGLPPAWLGIGTCDLFLDETRDYAARLAAAGVDVSFVEVPGAIHGFERGGTTMGDAFIGAQVEFLNRWL